MKKADMIKLLSLQEQLIAKQEEQIKALREERPMWAQGFTSDSVAAQVCTASLHQIWKELGVSSQTECMQKLRVMKLRTASAERLAGLGQTGALPANTGGNPHLPPDLGGSAPATEPASADRITAAAPGAVLDERKANPECIHCNGAGEVTLGGRLIFPCPCRP